MCGFSNLEGLTGFINNQNYFQLIKHLLQAMHLPVANKDGICEKNQQKRFNCNQIM